MLHNKTQNSIPSLSNQNEILVIDLLQNYLKTNPQIGYLTVYVYQDSIVYGRLPVANAKITLCKFLGNGFYVCKVIMTDIDGKTESVPVPTVSAELSRSPENVTRNAVYDINVEAPGFTMSEVFHIPVFEGITSIQNVNLSPVTQQVQQENLKDNEN